jgi:hypothetical protein
MMGSSAENPSQTTAKVTKPYLRAGFRPGERRRHDPVARPFPPHWLGRCQANPSGPTWEAGDALFPVAAMWVLVTAVVEKNIAKIQQPGSRLLALRFSQQ